MDSTKTIIGLISVAIVIVAAVAIALIIMAPSQAPNGSGGQIGGQQDEHGCLIAAGYSWCESKQKCLRTWEEECSGSPLGGVNSFEDCANAGYPIMESYPRQCRTPEGAIFVEEVSEQNAGGLYDCGADADCIPLPSECHPMECVNKRFEANYVRPQACTMMFAVEAAYSPEDCACVESKCVNKNLGKGSAEEMSEDEARQIALNSDCAKEGTMSQSAQYNTYTKTWWIDLTPNVVNPNCNPACVIYAVTGEAEVNWRCTGAIPPASAGGSGVTQPGLGALETITGFTCKDMFGFTFDYPIYEGWTVNEIQRVGESCFMKLSPPSGCNVNFEYSPTIEVKRLNLDQTFAKSTGKNDHEVSYYFDASDPSYVEFYGRDFNVEVSIDLSDGICGFSLEDFRQTVMDSFDFPDY